MKLCAEVHLNCCQIYKKRNTHQLFYYPTKQKHESFNQILICVRRNTMSKSTSFFYYYYFYFFIFLNIVFGVSCVFPVFVVIVEVLLIKYVPPAPTPISPQPSPTPITLPPHPSRLNPSPLLSLCPHTHLTSTLPHSYHSAKKEENKISKMSVYLVTKCTLSPSVP